MGTAWWVLIWLLVAVFTVTTFVLLGLRLYRSLMGLGHEAVALGEMVDDLRTLERELDTVVKAAQARRAAATPAPLRGLDDVRREYVARRRALAKGRRR